MEKKWKLFLTAWTIGLLGGILFWILRLTKRVEVFGCQKEKLTPKNKGLLVISNHPSLWEPALLPFLFFPRYLFLLRFVPFSLPDKRNFYDKWWFSPLRSACVSIKRGKRKEELRTINLLKRMLEEKKILILFPEGGRTFLGKKFRFSRFREKIREFPLGIERLFDDNCLILPIWTDGGELVVPNKKFFPKGLYFLLPRIWKKTKILIGQPFELKAENLSKRGRVKKLLEKELLKLADEFFN